MVVTHFVVMRPSFNVNIATAGMENVAAKYKTQEEADRVVVALNQAIVARL